MPAANATPMALAVGLAVLATACVERVIHDHACGDGRQARGELCLGEGARQTLTIDTLAPLALRVADFDGDGPPDLMVLGTDASGVVTARLWRGDGDGGFAPPIDPGVTGCSAHPVPGTIDGDAFTDLLVAECEPAMSVLRGTAAGVFEPPVRVLTGVTTLGSGLVDIDRDGAYEVLALGPDAAGQPALSASERSDDGRFSAAVLSPASSVDVVPTGLGGLFDADGDAWADVLLVQSGVPRGLAVAHGEDGLRFGPPRREGPSDLPLDGATTRDLDGDGRVDVLAVSFGAETYVVLDVVPSPSGPVLVERARTVVPGLRPGPAALADLDDDGREDLLLADSGAAALAAHRGLADGRFDEPVRIDLDAPAEQLAVADLDLDGALDLVVASFDAGQLRVLLSAP